MPRHLGILCSSSAMSLNGSVKEGSIPEGLTPPKHKHYTILGHTTTLSVCTLRC